MSSTSRQPRFLPYLVDLGIIILLILATIAINLRMIQYGLNGTGDLRWHITWIQHFAKELTEGIWYPRWLAGTNFGYGSPTLVYYPPLTYYLGAAFKLIGLETEKAITFLFSVGLFLTGLGFYIYGRYRWGKIAGAIGALFYLSAPGPIIYANGGVLGGLFALPWIPLGLYLTDKALIKPIWRIPLAIFWMLVALTHTPSLLLWAIAWGLYTLYFLLKRPWQTVVGALFSAGIGWGMACPYLIPAIFEQSFVNIDYPKLSKEGFQMFSLSQLLQGEFALFQQLIAIALLTGIVLLCARKNAALVKETWLWLAFSLLIFFLMSDLSWPFWQLSKTLQTIENTARLGGLLYFGEASLCALAVTSLLQWQWRWRILPSLIIAGLILLNFRYGYQLSRSFPSLHSPGGGKVFIRPWLETTLYDPYSDKLIDVPEFRPRLEQGDLTFYPRERYSDEGMPRVEISPAEQQKMPFSIPKLGQPRVSVVNGRATVTIEQWDSYQRQLKVTSQDTSTVRIRLYYYPAWHLYVNDKAQEIQKAEDGTIQLTLQPGTYTIRLRYQWTPAFLAGIILSLLSLAVLVGAWLKISRTSARRNQEIIDNLE
jgi:uncharacterized membrane protein